MTSRILNISAAAVVSAATLLLGAAQAATVTIGQPGVTTTTISHPDFAQLANTILLSPEDFFPSTVRAEADSRTGQVRVFANSGGDASATAGSASAQIEGAGVIIGPGGANAKGLLRYEFDVAVDALIGRTGRELGGTTFASSTAFANVGTGIGNNAALGFTTARQSVRYQNGYVFSSRPSGSQADVQSLGVQVTPTTFRNSPSINAVASNVDMTSTILLQNDFAFAGIIEILFDLRPNDILRFTVGLEAVARGAIGHIAAVNGLNTGQLSISLPEGWDFVPDNENFLSQSPQTAVVPLPPSILLLLSGLVGLFTLRRPATWSRTI